MHWSHKNSSERVSALTGGAQHMGSLVWRRCCSSSCRSRQHSPMCTWAEHREQYLFPLTTIFLEQMMLTDGSQAP